MKTGSTVHKHSSEHTYSYMKTNGCIHFNHDLAKSFECKMSLLSSRCRFCLECYCVCSHHLSVKAFSLYMLICEIVYLQMCVCVLAFLYQNNCLHEGNTWLCMEIRQAWLGLARTGPKWKGCGLEWGERERVHWSEMGHQGRVRKESKKRKREKNEGMRSFSVVVTAQSSSLPEGYDWHLLLFFSSDWLSAYRFASEHSTAVWG